MDATIKFRHTLPYAIFPASPALAALHAVRARSLHSDNLPTDHPLSCSRCGSFFSLQHSVTFVNNKSNRIYRRSCRICGTARDSLLPKTFFPPTRKHGTITAQPPIIIAQPPPQTIAAAEPPPNPPQPTATPSSKSRPKKKQGLQQLLARNREKEERDRKRQEQADSQFGGLAAFLGDLH